MAPSVDRALRAALLGACCLTLVPHGAAADCPDPLFAADHAKRGHALRRSNVLVDAASAFEAAYRCMPRDADHDARWEHLAALADVIADAPAGPERTGLQCRMRTAVRDFLDSIRAVQPRPESAAFAEDAARALATDLAGAACPATEAAPTPSPPTPAPTPDPIAATGPEPATAATPSTPADPRRPAPGRPLRIAGAAVGAAALVPLAVMAAGLGLGSRAESQIAAAKADGDLQRIHDDLRPAGATANRMAVAGAIVGGVLIVTAVAILTASRGARAPRSSRIVPAGGGLTIRF